VTLRMMRALYLAVYLLPTLSVLALVWFVTRAVSVRVVWRDAGHELGTHLDDEPA
jgi:hypothetical protein